MRPVLRSLNFHLRTFLSPARWRQPRLCSRYKSEGSLLSGVGKKIYRTHCVTICRKISTQNCISVSRKRFWSESFDWVQSKETSGHVPRCGDEAPVYTQISSSFTGAKQQQHVRWIWRPLYAQYIIVMPSVCSMQCKWCKLAEKVVRRPPNLNVRAVRNGNVSLNFSINRSRRKYIALRTIRSGKTVCPSLVYGSWSDEARRLYERLLIMHVHLRPKELSERFLGPQNCLPSSTEMSKFPSGLNPIAAIFFRFSKENVNDLLLRETPSGQRETEL